MTADQEVTQLRSQLRGEVIAPGDASYESARKVHNAMIDKRPRLIARCADPADVAAAVRFGRDRELLTSIRAGGHSAPGLGVCDDGLVIDLSAMRYTHVDPRAATVRVGGGATWGDVDHATHAYGLAVPGGVISTTGVAGLTLGGGLGHLTRSYGLSIDNLLSADLVLADGSFASASESENEDLFWAIRGGGGNFGVVTSLLFRAQPVNTVYAGPMLWEMDQAPEILRWYRELIPNSPGNLTGFFAFMIVPPGPPFPEKLHNRRMCGIVWCYTGPMARADEVFRPIRGFRKPVLDFAGPLPFPALQSMFDALVPKGLQYYWKADFANDIGNDAIEVHMKHAPGLPSVNSVMHIYPIDGAAHRVGHTDTAWPHRDTRWTYVIVGVDANPANRDRIVSWARNYWTGLHPYATGGIYVNFMMDEGEDRLRAAYGDNFGRLSAIKARYDPTNFFRVNQNIAPAAAAGGAPA